MNQEQVITLTSLLSAMQDAITLLEQAKKKNDVELATKTKRLLLDLQQQAEKTV